MVTELAALVLLDKEIMVALLAHIIRPPGHSPEVVVAGQAVLQELRPLVQQEQALHQAFQAVQPHTLLVAPAAAWPVV